MYCPICEAEYRVGFKTCSDCGVKLVAELPAREPGHSYVVLWKGEDAIFHDSLLSKLEETGIEYADTPLHVYARKNETVFGAAFGPHFGFVISVHSQDLSKARPILEKLLDVEPEDSPSEVRSVARNLYADVLSELPDKWDSSTATVELYSDKSEPRIAFLQDALREMGIPARRDIRESSRLKILVRPEDETRSREILRQINENAAPQEPLPAPRPSIWDDPPIRSFKLLWFFSLPWITASLYFVAFGRPGAFSRELFSAFADVAAFLSFVAEIGMFWMIYQALRYEVSPLRFVLCSFLPFSFIWYYFERYAERRGPGRFPIAVRARLQRPSTS